MPDDHKKFLDTFRGLAKELSEELTSTYEQDQYVQEWVRRLMYYTVPGGKMNRGLTVLHSLEALKKTESNRSLSEEEVFQAHVLGWCVEWLQAFFLISDDIMDVSITRRDMPCYYRSPHPLAHPNDPNRPTVGNIAINDAFIIESQIYVMLKKYFRTQPYYADLLELFHETSYQTELGQLLDLTSLRPGRLDFDSYTLERYNQIVKYKTAFYSFYMPVVLALVLHTGKLDAEMLSVTKSITLPMGEFFQVQDDYLDCYGKPEDIGKVGRDIEEAKCGWLIVKALKRCTPEQRQELEENYGQEDSKKVERVKSIYRALNMERVYREYEAASHAQLVSMINAQTVVPKVVFETLLGKIYKRRK